MGRAPRPVPIISRNPTTQVLRSRTATVRQSETETSTFLPSSASSASTLTSDPVRYVPILSPMTHHPRLMSVANLPPRLLARPIITGTGTVNPSIPGDYPTIAAEPSPTSLRTTADCVRLEITPTAMLALFRPEITIPTVISPPSFNPGGSVPDPDL